MIADFFTKPLQGKKFLEFCSVIMNLSSWTLFRSQECVGTWLFSIPYSNICFLTDLIRVLLSISF
jgi:hypothetical protein